MRFWYSDAADWLPLSVTVRMNLFGPVHSTWTRSSASRLRIASSRSSYRSPRTSRKKSSRVAPMTPRLAVRLRTFQDSSSMGDTQISPRRRKSLWTLVLGFDTDALPLRGGERLDCAFEDFVDQTAPVHLGEEALLFVVRDERLRLLVVHLDPAADGLLFVVLALDQPAPAPVAEARFLRRIRHDVIHGLAVLAHSPPRGPLDQA